MWDNKVYRLSDWNPWASVWIGRSIFTCAHMNTYIYTYVHTEATLNVPMFGFCTLLGKYSYPSTCLSYNEFEI